MAEKRMFAKSIIDSDAFLEMPVTSQLLYFHLSMRADDDGFINKPKAIMRMFGANDDDLKILFAKKFVIPFESGVVVIKHWRINNYIRKDMYHETNYKTEKALLELDENDAYRLVTSPLQVCNKTETQNRLGKVSIDKTRLDKTRDDDIQIQRAREAGLAVDEAIDALSPYEFTVEEVCDLAFRITDGQVRNPAAYVARYKQ